jgi:hypothetical protein
MQEVSLQDCPCGLEYRVVHLLNGHRQTFLCECSRINEVEGTILEIHARRPGSALSDDDEWVQVRPRLL